MKLDLVSKYLLDRITYDIFNREDIEIYLIEITNKLKIERLLDEPRFVSDIDKLARYNFNSRVLDINRNAIIDKANRIYEDLHDNGENRTIFINLYIYAIIAKQIVHIKQNYNIRKCKTQLDEHMKAEILYYSLLDETIDSSDRAYFAFEREAIVTALEAVLYIIKNYLYNENIYRFFRDWLIDTLLYGYKVDKKEMVTPSDYINNNITKIKASFKPKYDIYSMLKYGFPLPIWKFNYFKKKGNEIIAKKTLHQ